MGPSLGRGTLKALQVGPVRQSGGWTHEISKKEYTVRLFTDDTAGLMNALGISKAHVLGLSMGGAVAQELAINYPEKVQKLILCSTCSQHRGTQEERKMTEAMVQASKKEKNKMSLSSPLASDYPRDLLRDFPIAFLGLTSEFVKENPDLARSLLQLEEP